MLYCKVEKKNVMLMLMLCFLPRSMRTAEYGFETSDCPVCFIVRHIHPSVCFYFVKMAEPMVMKAAAAAMAFENHNTNGPNGANGSNGSNGHAATNGKNGSRTGAAAAKGRKRVKFEVVDAPER